MSPTKWTDVGSIWGTLRELDVSAIRNEAERALRIVCVGHAPALDAIDQLLLSSTQRYGPAGTNPLVLLPLDQSPDLKTPLAQSDMLLFGVDARVALSAAEADAFDRLERSSVPFLVVLLHGDRSTGAPLPRSVAGQQVTIVDPAAPDAADRLAKAMLERLPGELHLAAARRLPGVRAAVVHGLVSSTAFTNATYALASGLPEQIPIISVPFAAADLLVLTKNQALMAYRIALAYGAAPDFQARIREIIPVVGSAFVWRQAARSLIGLIPIWGLVPKIAIAYAGTYTTGVAVGRWFASGEIASADQLKRILNDATASGRVRAKEIIDRARASRAEKHAATAEEVPTLATNGDDKPGVFARLRGLLPGRKNKQ